MKKIWGVVAVLFVIGVFAGCVAKKTELSAVWGTTSVKKPILKSIAKMNGKDQVAFFVYTFDAKETYPGDAAYKDDDYFLEATVKAPEGKDLAVGEYKGDDLSLVLHTKPMNIIVGKPNSKIIIKKIDGKKIAGEFKLDDGSTKIMGPFEMDLM